jgi:hypothetical protein
MIHIILLIVIFLLGYFLWFRFKTEKESIEQVYKLTDLEKSYVNIVIKKERLELQEQDPNDVNVLQKLVDEDWLFAMTDGVIISSTKTDYIAKALK